MAVAPVTPRPDTVAGVLPVGIAGLGAYLPDRTVTNDALSQNVDTSDEWIRSRTGIAERRIAAPGQATADLAVAAARAALTDADADIADIGAVIVATTTPDHTIPGTAPAVASALGTEVGAMDLNAACSGFVYGLRTAGALAATGCGPVLLVGAETMSRVLDWTDRDTAILFGDGAAAAVLVADGEASLGPFDLGSEGSDPSLLWISAGGTREPITAEAIEAGRHHLRMRGREVYRRAVSRMTASSRRVLDDAGLAPADVDLLVGHQANERILSGVADRLGIPAARSHVSIDRHANTSAASIPLALDDAREAGALAPGARVLLTAFGAGTTWGSCLLTWRGGTS